MRAVLSLIALAVAFSAANASAFEEPQFGESPFDGKAEAAEDAKPTTTAKAPLVGQYGDIGRMEFSGNDTFTAEQLREALSWDVDVRSALRPSGTYSKLREVLDLRLSEGYKAAGFPFVEIHTADFRSPPRLGVFIAEGERFHCGEVVVQGADDVSTVALTEWLATPPDERPDDPTANGDDTKKSGKCLWREGQPAPFGDVAIAKLGKEVKSALAEQGRLTGTIRAHVRPKLDTGTAELVIDARRLGPPCVLAGVELVGFTKNSAEDVSNYLELKSGQPVNGELIRSVEQRLRDSGRFYECNALVEGADNSAEAVLVISGQEIEHLPPLSKPLNETQQSLMRLSTWLNGMAQRDEDAVQRLSAKGPRGECELLSIFSTRGGWLVSIRGKYDGVLLDHGLCITDGKFLLYSVPGGRKYEFAGLTRRPAISLKFYPKFNEDDEEWRSNVGFGITAASEDKGETPPLLSLSVQPATFLMSRNATIDDGKLIVIGDDEMRIEADAESGRLLQVTLEDDDSTANNFFTHFERGAFAAELAKMEASAEGLKNSADEGHEFASLAAFVIDEVYRLVAELSWKPTDPVERDVRLSMVQKLLCPLEELIMAEVIEPKPSPFSIPPTKGAQLSLTDFSTWVQFVAHFLSDEYPYGTWPWAIAHEASLVAAGEGSLQSLTELHRLLEDENTGPLAMLLFAQAAGLVQESLGAGVATRGLERLDDPKKFRSDIEALIPAEGKIAKLAARLVESLRSLTDEEFAVLVQSVPDDWRPVMALLDEHIRRGRDAAPREALLSLLEATWDRWGRAAARQEMQRIAGQGEAVRR